MAITLAYVCDKCGRRTTPNPRHGPQFQVCVCCNIEYVFAPWSYGEVIGAVGLAGQYQFYRRECIRLGAPMLDERGWLQLPVLVWAEPAMLIRAAQQGVSFIPPAAAQAKMVELSKLVALNRKVILPN